MDETQRHFSKGESLTFLFRIDIDSVWKHNAKFSFGGRK